MSSKWNHFEHQIWNEIKTYELENCTSFLIAVSGGLDSMALLQVMLRLRPQAKIRVAHFHHGEADLIQKKYRDDVSEFLKHKISDLNLPRVTYHLAKAESELRNEAELRMARWKFLREIKEKNEPILTAHHLDDWVETSTLKMLRGTSLEGISAFKVWNSEIFRPFLKISKAELKKYAIEQSVVWHEDPSNESEDYLRNWVREKWFVDLEKKQTGAYLNFSKSLLRIVEEYTQSSTFELSFYSQNENQGLDRMWYFALSHKDQLKALALYLKKRQIYVFTHGQLEEVNKRLDKNQKDLTFNLFGRKWVINAMQIMLE